MDIATISAALSSIDIASKFLKGHIEQIKDSAVRGKLQELLDSIIPLYSEVMSLQLSNGTYIQKIAELEKKLREIEDWKTETLKYQLKELASGVYAYEQKPESNSTEPRYYLCPNCFDTKQQKSIFQRVTQDGRGTHYACHGCGNKICDHSKPSSESFKRMVYSNGVII